MVDQTRTLTVLAEGIERLIEKIDQLDTNRSSETEKNSSTSSIQVHAGGAALWVVAWISSMACCLMLGMAIVGGLWGSSAFQQAAQERAENRARISDAKDYIAAIYQVAPELQKRLEEAKKADQKSRE